MRMMFFIVFSFVNVVFAQEIEAAKPEVDNGKKETKKEQVLDFSAGVIEGELNRPSMLMELGSNYKDFNDLILLREDFNVYHELDSNMRFKYIDENL